MASQPLFATNSGAIFSVTYGQLACHDRYSHPDVLDAAVVAKPDDKWGEVPCAFVELRQGAEATTTADVLDAFCR